MTFQLDLTGEQLVQNASVLKDQVVFLTGGASGFGHDTSIIAAENGAKVFIVDLNKTALDAFVDELKAKGGQVEGYIADITKPEVVRAAFDQCVKSFGVPDVVYANAGVAANDKIDFDDLGEQVQPWVDITLRINLGGLLTTSAVAQDIWAENPRPEGARKPRLVLTASLGGFAPIPGATAYCASKHATVAYWKALSDALKAGKMSGFECHAVCPFFCATPILPRITLFLLAGLPFTPISMVSKTLIYAGIGSQDQPPEHKKLVDAAGGMALLLPDDGAATALAADDYYAFSDRFEAAFEARLARNQ
ncbi:uncharacterized protein EHS24_006362 [Apiotrichum porosum]|uniref:NAD(P)-binding protein n=1 Tax=Apiotrichum porosum TaxID=105984 RepID=A0A427Y1B4_9TREE|nr:uncharacterized protein EHS24_006362 [Apiotrichum porosum]RSH84833.1 hypothetical protein EHS24_006362 [Apiotrichum porosum]